MIRTKLKYDEDKDTPVLIIRVTGAEDILQIGLALQNDHYFHPREYNRKITTVHRFRDVGLSIVERLKKSLGGPAFWGVKDTVGAKTVWHYDR